MDAYELFSIIVNHLKQSELNQIAVFSELSPGKTDSLNKVFITISLVRDALKSKYENDKIQGIEIQFNLYCADKELNKEAETLLRKALQSLNFENNYITFDFIARFYNKFISTIGLWNSLQVYRFYVEE